MARSEEPANPSIVKKISLFTGVKESSIALLPNAASIYEVPLTLEDSGIGDEIVNLLNLKAKKPDLKNWRKMVDLATKDFKKEIRIGFIAKYLDNTDTYVSVFESLKSAALWNKVKIDIDWVDSTELESQKNLKKLSEYDGILVPGGFGKRGLEGKINAAKYAYQNKIPYLGICLGMQMAVIALARLSNFKDATSFEIDPKSKYQVITNMNDQKGKENTGGTMRLGNYNCNISKDSLTYSLYKQDKIVERHRHRGECNPKYTPDFDKWGLKISGLNPDNKLVEIIEAKDHPFYVGCQFHPEFKSRPTKPHPLFEGFISAILKASK